MLRFDADQRKVIQQAKLIQRTARQQATKARPKSPKADRGRERDNGYLAFLRRQPCVTCGAHAPNDAAHIRMACREIGKPSTGMQVKPSDQYAVSLCRTCHTTQHSGAESRFWQERGIDPFVTAATLYQRYQKGQA